MTTAQDLAKELDVTVQTIRNESHRQNVKMLPKPEGRGYYFSEESAELIRAAIRDRQQTLEHIRKEKENYVSFKEVQRLREQLREKDEEIETRKREISHLNEKIQLLEEKTVAMEKTLTDYRQQVSNLAKTLENTSETLKAAQVLHMGTMKQIEKQDRKWWQFWKARTDKTEETTEEPN